jgi:hypothetical protein
MIAPGFITESRGRRLSLHGAGPPAWPRHISGRPVSPRPIGGRPVWNAAALRRGSDGVDLTGADVDHAQLDR